MPHLPEEHTPENWHRYFAIEGNNLAWDLSLVKRTPEQDRQLLDAAHSSALHWNVIGTDEHRMRATMLLAEGHCLAGSPELAFQYATEMHEYFAGKESDLWELALAQGILAHAAKLTGDTALHVDMYEQATITLNNIESKEDRDIVAATFAHIPSPA